MIYSNILAHFFRIVKEKREIYRAKARKVQSAEFRVGGDVLDAPISLICEDALASNYETFLC